MLSRGVIDSGLGDESAGCRLQAHDVMCSPTRRLAAANAIRGAKGQSEIRLL